MATPTLHWRRYTAECVGTGLLTFAVLGSISQNTATPFVAALVLMLMVYITGGISGAHVNPAVTAALWSVKRIKSSEAIAYIVAQVVGAIAAQLLFLAFLGTLPEVTVTTTWAVAVGEAVGAFVFLLGISAVVYDKVHRAAGGLVVGSSLLLGILLASLASNGVLNPAVAIGIRSISAWYLVAPFVGAILAVQFFHWLTKPE